MCGLAIFSGASRLPATIAAPSSGSNEPSTSSSALPADLTSQSACSLTAAPATASRSISGWNGNRAYSPCPRVKGKSMRRSTRHAATSPSNSTPTANPDLTRSPMILTGEA